MSKPAIDDDEARRIRALIPAARHASWLNSGMLGPIPQAAIDAMQVEQQIDFDYRVVACHWERIHTVQQSARAALAALVGLEASNVALMHSTHEGINTCIWGMDLRPGDQLITTDEENPGLLVPMRHARARTGCELRISEWRSDPDEFVATMLAQVTPATRAVIISHVSWMTGRIAPIRQLRAALPDGCRLIVDGAQSAGAMVVDPDDGWDAYTVSGHKWPLGPNGTGCLALRDIDAWAPMAGAYAHVTDPTDSLGSQLVDDARRFETSQESLAPLAGITASVTWLSSSIGIDRIDAHARALNVHARTQLRDALHLEDAAMHGEAHLLCVDVPGDANTACTTLCDAGIVVRALLPHRVRISLGAWTSTDEIDACARALEQALLTQH